MTTKRILQFQRTFSAVLRLLMVLSCSFMVIFSIADFVHSSWDAQAVWLFFMFTSIILLLIFGALNLYFENTYRTHLIYGWCTHVNPNPDTFPLDNEEKSFVQKDVDVLLQKKAFGISHSFGIRDDAKKDLAAVSEQEDGLSRIVERRKRISNLKERYEKLNRTADEDHKAYLAFWDMLKEMRMLPLSHDDPEKFRKSFMVEPPLVQADGEQQTVVVS